MANGEDLDLGVEKLISKRTLQKPGNPMHGEPQRHSSYIVLLPLFRELRTFYNCIEYRLRQLSST